MMMIIFFVFAGFFLALNKFKVPIKTLLLLLCYRKKGKNIFFVFTGPVL